MAVKSFDPATGITVFDDGSTYQAPHNYGTASNPSWALNDAQQTSMFGDQGAAVNAALGRTHEAIPAWQTSGQAPAPAPASGGGATFGGGTTTGTTGNNSYGGSMSSGGASTAGQNPYLQQMGNVMVGQMTDNFARRVMPSIASGAMAAGNFGGSRQGVVEANAINDLNQQIGGALTNLYGQGYNTTMQHDLGQQNLGLGYANLDRNINNDNLNWQMQGANFGLGVYDRMQQANNLGLGAGSQIQNTPLNYWSQFSQGANSLGQGYGTTTQSSGGNPFMGALGGAQLGNQIGNWWNSQQPSNGTSWFTGTQGMGD